MVFKRYLLLFFLFFPFFTSAVALNADSLRGELQATRGVEKADILNALSAKLHSDSGRAALRYAQQALEIAQQHKDILRELKSYINMGLALTAINQFSEAEIVLSKALALKDLIPDSTLFIPLFKVFGSLHVQKAEFSKGLYYLNQALNIIRNGRLPEDPYILHLLAYCYRGIGDNKLALSYNEDALEIYKMGKNEDACVSIYFALGLIYSEWGWNEKALGNYDKALRIQIRSNDSMAAAYTLMNMSGIYNSELGNKKGLYYNKMALDIFRKLRNPRGVGYALNGLGSYYLTVNKPDSAILIFLQAIHNYELVGFTEGLAFVYANLGDVYMKNKNYPLAHEYYIKSLSYADSLESRLATCTTLASLGKLYYQTGQLNKAFNCFQQSLEIAVSRNFKEVMSRNYLSLSEVAKVQGKFALAFDYMRLYHEIKDSLYNEKSQKAIAEMEARFSLEKKERQLALLIKENQLKEFEIESRKRTTIIMVTALGTLVLLLALLTWFYILKHRANTNYVRLSLDHLRKDPSLLPDQKLISQLKPLMTDERIFLNPELTLTEVAQKLNTNTTYLSRAINEELNKNFSTFINEYRIREAQKMLASKSFSNRSIEGIALSVGFNSKSSFNSAFKKYTGVTPSFFQRSAMKMES